jgi:transcriptional regulator with XRE-family HTH domain
LRRWVSHATREAEKKSVNHRVDGQFLRVLREDRLIERAELARDCGISYSTLAQLETNPNRTARTQTIKNLARALDIDPVKLTIPLRTSFDSVSADILEPLLVVELSDGTRVVGV